MGRQWGVRLVLGWRMWGRSVGKASQWGRSRGRGVVLLWDVGELGMVCGEARTRREKEWRYRNEGWSRRC
jgi:hypothetical protein